LLQGSEKPEVTFFAFDHHESQDTLLVRVSPTLLLVFKGFMYDSPTEACKKWLPILESRPIALATSDTSAPVASQIALIAFMLEIR